MLTLTNLLLSESLLSNFPNKNALLTEVSFCATINGLPLKRIICVMEKEVNGRFNTITATTSRIVFKYLFFQMSKTNSPKCPKFKLFLGCVV